MGWIDGRVWVWSGLVMEVVGMRRRTCGSGSKEFGGVWWWEGEEALELKQCIRRAGATYSRCQNAHPAPRRAVGLAGGLSFISHFAGCVESASTAFITTSCFSLAFFLDEHLAHTIQYYVLQCPMLSGCGDSCATLIDRMLAVLLKFQSVVDAALNSCLMT